MVSLDRGLYVRGVGWGVVHYLCLGGCLCVWGWLSYYFCVVHGGRHVLR